MKAVNIIIALFVTLWLALMGFGIYQGWSYISGFVTSANPLRAEILRETEKQKRKTAKTLAAIDRQTKLESNAGVNFAAVALAMFWRLSLVLLFGSALTGGLVYAFTRRVRIESPIADVFPRKDAFKLASMALQCQSAESMGKVAAFSEETTRARLADTDFARAIRPGTCRRFNSRCMT